MRQVVMVVLSVVTCVFGVHTSVQADRLSVELMRRQARLVTVTNGISPDSAVPDPPMDGIAMAALSAGRASEQYLRIIKNGVTPKGESCPPAPLKNCTMQLNAKQAFQHFAQEFLIFVEFAKFSCIDYADFASSVALTKSTGSSIDDVLNTLNEDFSKEPAKLALLEGAVAAVYTNDTTPKKAYAMIDDVCNETWRH